MKQRLRLRPWVIVLFMMICMVGIAYYSYQIVLWKLHVDENKRIHDEIKDAIKIVEGEEVSYEIDFAALKEQNADTIAYLNVPSTNIDYIVVRGENNEFYLTHNFDKAWNMAGWIFADYRNQVNGLDQNLVIFGHSTKDGSMFGTLDKVIRSDWYENSNNHTITLTTESGTMYYQVFSTYSTVPEDYYIQTSFSNENEFDSFLKEIKKRSVYDYGVELSKDDTILTLSSCLEDGRKRVVLHAKRIIEEKETTVE